MPILRLETCVHLGDAQYGPGDVEVPEPVALQLVTAMDCPVLPQPAPPAESEKPRPRKSK